MQWIWVSFKYLYAILAIVPIVPFLLLYFGFGAYTGDRKKAFRIAMDATTALLIGCVAVLFNRIFNQTFGLYGILLILLIAAGLLGNVQHRVRGEINFKKILRAVWRLCFFTMSAVYIILMGIGIGQGLFAA